MNIDRMHTIECPFTQTIGNIWVLNGKINIGYFEVYRWGYLARHASTHPLQMRWNLCVSNIIVILLFSMVYNNYDITLMIFLVHYQVRNMQRDCTMHFLQFLKYWVFPQNGKSAQNQDNEQRFWVGYTIPFYKWYCYQKINDCYCYE